jgi:hypothetical protein
VAFKERLTDLAKHTLLRVEVVEDATRAKRALRVSSRK